MPVVAAWRGGKPQFGAADAPLEVPAAFGWTPPFSIYKTGGVYSTTYDVTTLAPSGTAYYVDVATGNDANAGTAEAPLQKIKTAATKADAVVVYVKPGHYNYSNGLSSSGTLLTKNLAIKRWPGESGRIIITSRRDDVAMVLDETYTNCYKATRAGVANVLDISNTDADGDYVQLTKVADAATCDATANSWAQVGTTLYIHRTDLAQPTLANTEILITYAGLTETGDYTLYVEHCDFRGYGLAISSSAGGQSPTLVLLDCSIMYAPGDTGNGVSVNGAYMYSQDCNVSKNGNDGFNYDDKDGNDPHGLEISSTCYRNGNTAADENNQASSAHDGYVVRLNCEYYGNYGPNIADVVGNAWCLGCNVHDSAISGDQDGNYKTGATMWVDGCISSGSAYDLIASAGATIYYRDLTSGGNNAAGGTYTAY